MELSVCSRTTVAWTSFCKRLAIHNDHSTIPILSFCATNINNRNSRFLCCASSPIQSPRTEMSFCVGTHLIPHPNKNAFFVSGYRGGIIAVADGVSGWAEELMSNASCLVEDEGVNYDPQILLRKAHAATSSVGSATIIVAMLERNGVLKISNVGYRGLKVIRRGCIIFSPSLQEHYFDCPYLLSSEKACQMHLDAVISTVELSEGDTIVMGLDGLFDNVFDHEILSTLARYSDVAEAVAKVLANLAREHSMDSEFESPYSLKALSKGFDVPWWKKILGKMLTGRKLDDVTVIVGQMNSLNSVVVEGAISANSLYPVGIS